MAQPSTLLDDVTRGETITITRNGVPVAVLAPPVANGTPTVSQAVAGLRAFRRAHKLRTATIRGLIDEGRR